MSVPGGNAMYEEEIQHGGQNKSEVMTRIKENSTDSPYFKDKNEDILHWLDSIQMKFDSYNKHKWSFVPRLSRHLSLLWMASTVCHVTELKGFELLLHNWQFRVG